MTTQQGSLTVSNRARGIALGLVVLSAAIAAWGLMTDPARMWPVLLVNGLYVLELAVAGLFFFAALRVTGARWSAGIRRVPEALGLTLPVGAVLLLVVFIGRESIYSWVRPGAFAHETIAGRVQYLQPGGMLVRTIVCIAIWAVFAVFFRRTSLAQDHMPRANLQMHSRLNKLSAAFVVLFAFSFTAVSYDWIISVDPEWFSTMFSVNAFAGTFVQGIAAVTLAVIFLAERGRFGNTVGHHQFHDLGKLLLSFTTFWAYTWLCQYLLIWYSNIPEEVTHYANRTNGPWLVPFVINFLINWIIPFATLLSFKTKKSTKVLKVICTLLLVGHWLDIYMQVMPSIRPGPTIGIFEIGTVVGYVALAYLVFVQALSRAPIVPVHDPVLIAEAQAPTHAHA